MSRRHPLPAEIYALVEQTPAAVLLEDSSPSSPHPLSRLFVEPLRTIEAAHESDLPELFTQIERATKTGHFAAGYFTYECGNYFEPAARTRPAQPGQPLAWFGIYSRCYLFDHNAGAFEGGEPMLFAKFRTRTAGLTEPSAESPAVTLGLTEQEYSACVDSIHEWIRAGDVYQLNFTFPLRVRWQDRPASLYSRLRHRQPVAYGAFLHTRPGSHILSFSPELFFRVEAQHATRRIITQPMKGTAPRGRTTAEDEKIAQWLRSDPKNCSENVMIVDLLRNDLGRLCAFGSVKATNLFALERHHTLWQLTSTVSGDLRPDVGYEDILQALFPCGSITGAPKIRAMQLLAQIENRPRGVYTGAIGYFSAQRSVFSVAIRTLDLQGHDAEMGVGSGIVIDSRAQDEYRECCLKAEFLTASEETFSLVETLIWRHDYPLIELHLDRLQDSAHYFDFPFDRAATVAALQEKPKSFTDRMPRKVRLLLNAEGDLHIEHQLLPVLSVRDRHPGRVCFARHRIDPHDRMFFHKTTHRPLYAAALKAANEAGYDDVLFMNLDGQVTEGAMSNVFIEHHGRWYTPPIECGLLPGIYRRHLLQTKATTHERILYPDDLKAADAVYLTNAVRGLRHVSIDWEREPI